ncbi:MAG: extracellular solute-binding protein [Betaproteobacteria bacterium]|nr:extracellular solute-binding protein [Betaproteobacteria bacterium]MDH3436379.1 extracellular solute-binding protein [Betaproteobacteria bacterium]
MSTSRILRRAVLLLAVAPALLGLPTQGQAAEDKVIVVTSFPKDLTGKFKSEFEKRNPGVKVEILSKNTSSGIKYVQETAANNTSDIFWASAPDAFEVLKGDGLLQKYTPKVAGIPEKVGAYPINDPDGYYTGFAAAGYGIMWNTRYLKAKKLKPAKEWADLAKPVYHGHVGMSAPSRSGTTHLTVETVLQGEGWEKGWASWKEMAGNFKTVTERSFGVPDGVNSGDFGFGIVIDFFGLSSQASGFPVEFVYPTVTTLVPANVAILKNSPHPQAAAAFIEFLLSPEGQTTLLDPKIRRLPVNPATYAKAPPGFPNPFKDKSIGAVVKFDVDLSKRRYNVVNSLFDVMVTYRLDDLKAATRAIQKAQAAAAKRPNDEKVAGLIKEARALVAAVPVTEAQASDPGFSKVFKKKRRKKTDKLPQRQAEVEEQWDAFVTKNYAEALAKAEQALSMAR